MSRSGATALPTWPSAQTICFAPDVALSQAFVKLQQPTTVPIANLVSTPKIVPSGDLIDVSSSYIVYGVKNGLVRVIDRNSAARILLRGHDEPITDVAFFGRNTTHVNEDGNEANVVATVGGRGSPETNVLIWRILKHGPEDMTTEKLLEIKLRSAERIIWHPFNPNQLVLSHRVSNNSLGSEKSSVVVASYIVTTNLTTEPHRTEGHAVCHAEKEQYEDKSNVIPGALQLVIGGLLNPDDAMIQDMCWSHKDTRYVLTAHSDGHIRLWDLRSRVLVSSDGEQMDVGDSSTTNLKLSAKCLFKVKAVYGDANGDIDSEGGAVHRCMFLHHYDCVFDNSVTDMESLLTTPFITSTRNGSTVTLWSPFSSTGSLPSVVKGFELANGRYQLALCTIHQASSNIDINVSPPSTYLILADESEGYIYALHLAVNWSERKKKDGSYVSSVSGFDFIVPFETLYPIYSFSSRPSDSSKDIDLFCVQSKAIQMLTLTSSKCCAPPLLNENDEILPPGVTCIYSANEGEKIVSSAYEYEDFDDVDDAQNGIDVDRSSDQDESGDDLDSTPLDAEDGDTFIESMPCFSDGIRTGAFANWLGSLATIEPQSFVPPTPQVTPLVKSKVADKSLLSGIRDLSDISLPASVSDSSTSYSRDNRATPAEVAQAPLLSPMEFLLTSTPVKGVDLSVHPSKTNEPDAAILSADGALPLASADSKKNTPIIKKNVTKTGAVSSMKLLDQKVMKSSSKEAPLPKIDAKVSILKRAEESESKESVKPSSFCSTEEYDVMVRKAVASQFKQQESILVMEIQKSVRSEMHSFLLPSLNKTIAQSVEQAILKTLAASVAIQIQEASSTHLKDMIEAVKEPINDTFYSSMREFMVPAFESATKQMFGQISSTLQSGLTAYNHHNGSEDLLKVVHHMAERMDAMSKMIELLIATVNQLSNSPAASDGRSTAVSVHDPKQDLQHEILSLLNAKEYERAFTKALSISDVEFALLVCKNADLLTVLEGETPCLSQPILLCLMQQLGTNITIANIDDTKLILAWLQSIAIILDPENETIKKHVLNICAQVTENINRKLPNCDSSIRRPLQMLLQVIRGIGTI